VTAAAAPGVPRLVHEALLYTTPEEFVGVAAPFLRSAIDSDESALVVSDQANMAAVRGALGAGADRVDWEDTTAWYPKPVDRIQALHGYVGERLDGGVARVRIIDESAWPTDSVAAVSELKRFESICNLLFAPLPVWMVCPYNASLFNHILPDAYRTHPVIRDARVSRQASVATSSPASSSRHSTSNTSSPPRRPTLACFASRHPARCDRSSSPRRPPRACTPTVSATSTSRPVRWPPTPSVTVTRAAR